MMYANLYAAIQESFAGANVELMPPSYLSVRDGNTSTVPKLGTPAQTPHA